MCRIYRENNLLISLLTLGMSKETLKRKPDVASELLKAEIQGS